MSRGRKPLDPAGLAPRGEANGRARLDAAGVYRARRLAREGWGHRRIAAELGVSPSAVQALLSGRTWKHVPDTRRRPLDAAKVAEARDLRRSGRLTLHQLARRYGVDVTTLCDALFGRTWKHVPGACVPRRVVESIATDPGTAAS